MESLFPGRTAAEPTSVLDDNDDSLPALEEIEIPDHLRKDPASKDWHVFHPVFGVIPRDTRDLWKEQEREREAHLKKLLKNPRSLPPVRFSETDDPQNSDDDKDLYEPVALDRTISGFDVVGIE
jgi:hypothetical protein